MSRSAQPPPTRRERRAAARLERPDRHRRHPRATSTPNWRSPMVLVSAAALVVGAVIVLVALPKPVTRGEDLQSPPYRYPAGLAHRDILGDSSAPVVIELFSDFQCPACRLFVTEELHRLVVDFVVPGTVRIEARDVAFLGRGQPDESLELATGAACAAEQDRYWPFHDLVFWNQGSENRGDHDAAFLAQVADEAGVDRTVWDACIARPDVRPPITSRTAAAAAAGVNSTPTLLVNGQRVVGVPDYDQLAALIRSLAAQASPVAAEK